MRRLLLLTCFGLQLMVASLPCWGAGVQTAVLPVKVISTLASLTTNTNRLLVETNDPGPFSRTWRSQDPWSYEQALGFLSKLHLPDIVHATRVKTAPPPVEPLVLKYATTNSCLGLWLQTNAAGQSFVFGADFQPVPLEEVPLLRFEPTDFREELQALADLYTRRIYPTNLAWNLSFLSPPTQPRWFDSQVIRPEVLTHEFICGLWVGMTNEVREVMDSVRFRVVFTNSLAGYVRAQAILAWNLGLANLHAGRALGEVLELWTEHVRVFGTNVVPDLAEHVAVLEKQMGEFRELRDSAVEDPQSLPQGQRANYYCRRLTQARHQERGVGSFGAGSPTPELVAVGRAALPALLAHLEDRRLTRVAGNQDTKIVLVQDLALDCFEEIAGGSFRTNYQTIGKFSVLPPTNREAIVNRVRDWLAEYGAKHEAFGKLALNEWKPVSRIFTLDDMESRFPGVVDGMIYLKRWAAEGRDDELRALAWRMSVRNDLSLLPRVRASVRAGNEMNGECLAVFGDPNDFLLLRDAIRSRLMETNLLPAHVLLEPLINLALGKATNRITPPAYTLPILLETLECRRFTPASSPPKTLADVVFPALIKLTGSTNSYTPNASPSTRMAEIDLWMNWWEKEGAAAFSTQHPAVKTLFGRWGSEDALEAPDRLPDRILVTPVEPVSGKEYSIGREDAIDLARKGNLRLRLLGDSAVGRFLDSKAEEQWSASPRSQSGL